MKFIDYLIMATIIVLFIIFTVVLSDNFQLEVKIAEIELNELLNNTYDAAFELGYRRGINDTLTALNIPI